MATQELSCAPPVAVQEEWRDAIGYAGRYQVSDQGRVWSGLTDRILRSAPTSRGYPSVVLYNGARPKQARSFCVHDLVAAAFIGPKPFGQQVDHVDGNKENNAVSNLQYVTGQENMRRADARGRVRHVGSDHANSKLTPTQVKHIRHAYRAGTLDAKQAAKQLGVCIDVVFDAARGVSYKNVI